MSKIRVLTSRSDSKGNKVFLQGVILPPSRTVVIVLDTLLLPTPVAIVPMTVEDDGLYIDLPVRPELLELIPHCAIEVYKTEQNIMGMTVKQFRIVHVALDNRQNVDPTIKSLKDQQDEHAPDQEPL